MYKGIENQLEQAQPLIFSKYDLPIVGKHCFKWTGFMFFLVGHVL